MKLQQNQFLKTILRLKSYINTFKWYSLFSILDNAKWKDLAMDVWVNAIRKRSYHLTISNGNRPSFYLWWDVIKCWTFTQLIPDGKGNHSIISNDTRPFQSLISNQIPKVDSFSQLTLNEKQVLILILLKEINYQSILPLNSGKGRDSSVCKRLNRESSKTISLKPSTNINSTSEFQKKTVTIGYE